MPKQTAHLIASINQHQHGAEFKLSYDGYGKNEVIPGFSVSALKGMVKDYWAYVNHQMQSATLLVKDPTALRVIHNRLKTRGNAIRTQLFSDSFADHLWKTAAYSDYLVLHSENDNIPWEALYHSGKQSFLIEETKIIRQPYDNGNGGFPEPPSTTPSPDFDYQVFIDPQVDNCVENFQTSPFDEHDTLSSFIDQECSIKIQPTTVDHKSLVDEMQRTKCIFWICEHAKEGLRIGEETHYCNDDAEVFPIGSDKVLFLIACQPGLVDETNVSIVEQITLKSRCVVIAPHSAVGAAFGTIAACQIQRELNDMQTNMSIAEFWWSFINSSSVGELTISKCLGLWFGIYGNSTNIYIGDTHRED